MLTFHEKIFYKISSSDLNWIEISKSPIIKFKCACVEVEKFEYSLLK